MMKSFALAAVLASSTQALLDFDNLPDIDLDQFEAKTFTQWKDQSNYLNTETYEQRYWVSDQYYDGEGPIFVYICGEYRCTVPDTRLYPFMVGSQYNARFLVVEHRFYGDSQPFDDWSLESFTLLSAQQALADLAIVISELNPNNGEVLVIGGSYPGAMSAWFRSRYPHIAVGSWSSSGVVNPIVDFQDYDGQIYTSLAKYGDKCAPLVQQAMVYVTEQGELRDSGDEDNFVSQSLADTSVPDLRTDDWQSYFADIPSGAVQYGGSEAFCEIFADCELGDSLCAANAIVAYGNDTGSNPADYSRSIIADTTIDPMSSGRPWTFQYCTQYGWYQTMSDKKMRSPLVDEAYFAGMCADAFSGIDMEYYPDVTRSERDLGALDTAGTNIFFANGGEDPWQWATRRTGNADLNQVAMISDCDGCGHCTELYTPKEDDPEELKATRIAVDKWVADLITYRPKETATEFTQ